MKLLEDERYRVERAKLEDEIAHEGARMLVHDENAAAVGVGKRKVCVFRDVCDFYGYADKYGLYGDLCFLGAPENTPALLGFDAPSCKTFAYFRAMPPSVELPKGVTIKRLAPSLAGTVAAAYTNRSGGYYEARMQNVMRGHGVFGAISDGKLAGFIGRHDDGSMGMLEVFEPFRRKGIGGALVRFLINYIMTFGRIPVCDVYEDNMSGILLQNKLGLTPSQGHAFWCEISSKRA